MIFSITAGAGGKFSINSATGQLSTAGTVTSGDSYNLTIKVADIGGLTNSSTLSISISAVNLTQFYRSAGNTNANAVCNDAIGNIAWHDGLGSTPSDGDKVYTSALGGSSNLFNGQNAYYAFNNEPDDGTGTHVNGTINSSGVVSNLTLCSE